MLAPHLKIINSTNADGIYGIGDEIYITLQFSSVVYVHGVPTLTLNTGCHDSYCTVNEVQSFTCYADMGKFGVELNGEYVMNIDANTTQDAFKYKLEQISGINDVTIKYSDVGDYEYTNGRRICTSIGNNVTVTFQNASFPQYNGNVPAMHFDATNSFKDPRTQLSLGDGSYLKGRHVTFQARISPAATEVVQGFQQQDSVAYYVGGNNSDTLYFRYVVRAHDNSSLLEVSSLNFGSGYIYSDATGYNVSTVVPTGVTGQRYMSSAASSLGFSKTIIIATTQPQVVKVTSPNADGTYTQGDVLLIYVVFNLPVKVLN